MSTSSKLDLYLDGAPAALCTYCDAGEVFICRAKGKARNKFPVLCKAAAIALETDDEQYRFPPEKSKEVCDWCVFTEDGHIGCFVELKGSDYMHALAQLASTMCHMKSCYKIEPRRAFVMLSGAHPANSLPGKANAKVKFKKQFPRVELYEPPRGQSKPEDIFK